MRKLSSLFVLFLLLALTISISAQEDVLRPKTTGANKSKKSKQSNITLGLEAGMNFNFFSQKQEWNQAYYGTSARPTAYDAHESGFGISPFFGFMFDYSFNNKWGIQAKLMYDHKYVTNSKDGYDWAKYSDNEGEYTMMNYEYEANASYLGLGVLLRYNITNNLFVNGGIMTHFLMGDVEVKHTGKVNSDNVMNDFDWWRWVSANTANTRQYSTTINEKNQTSVRLALEAGIGYKIPIAKKLWLVPQSRFQLFMSTLGDDTALINPVNGYRMVDYKDKLLNSLQVSLALWWDI